jgi:CRP-like cAMP-binding protein
LIEETNSSWSKALLRQVCFVRLSFSDRLKLVLMELAMKFGQPVDDGTLISLKFGYHDWAQIIGCSRPVIGRIFSEMVADQWIQLLDGGRILLREELRALPSALDSVLGR